MKRMHQNMAANGKSGFTLLELSIVLIGIGLLVGGVLVGRDLIDAARQRGVLKEFESYQLAIQTYKLKYNCYAGDCNNATQFGAKAHFVTAYWLMQLPPPQFQLAMETGTA